MTVASIAWWILAWTVLAGGTFVVAQVVTGGLRNAAARHLAWLAAFSAVWFFPAFAAVTIVAQRQGAHCDVPAAAAVTPGAPNALLLVGGAALMAWGGGFAFTLARAAFALRSTGRLYARSRPLPDALVSPHLPGFARRVDLRLASDEDLAAPITWGVRKPVVLLPASATQWDSSRRAAAILHELAHVRRLDNLTQLFALFTCAVNWFNPLVWHAARRMEADAEIAADDFAILRGVRPSTYAQELLHLATQLSHNGPARDFAQTAMVKASSALEHRLLAIVDPDASRGPIRPYSFIAVAALLLCAAVTTVLVTPRVAVAMRPEAQAPPSCLATNPS